MGDDFDLFPKRENLDPFSFGTREKKNEADEAAEGPEELFVGESQPPSPPPLPDLPLDVPPVELGELGGELPTLEPTIPDPPPPELPDFPPPPLIPPPPADPIEAAPEPFPGGPISEEKTFDEPVYDDSEPSMEQEKRSGRKAPSPFIVIGGALIIIIGLLYGALTYLKKDKPAPRPTAPPVSVSVPAPKPVPVPAPKPQPEPAKPAATTPATTPDPVVAAPVPKPEPKPAPKPAPKPEPAVTPAPAPKPAISTAASGQVQYSVQVGALILKSSVEELEKKLRVLGHDPFRKAGSTTAMMNMLTVGPFATVSQAQSALSRLKGAGVDSNVRRRADGGAVINAGSYLLEENANSVMKKVRSLGYPVRLSKSEAKLPMTFVRVGRYSSMVNASTAKDELRDNGFDAIVVKLQ
jgi:cell division septation protein DedD